MGVPQFIQSSWMTILLRIESHDLGISQEPAEDRTVQPAVQDLYPDPPSSEKKRR